MPYIPGDFYRVCAYCGQKYRQSQMRKDWKGDYLCPKDWEPRHPQDFVRGKKDRQSVHEPRPEPQDYFLSDNEVSADDL